MALPLACPRGRSSESLRWLSPMSQLQFFPSFSPQLPRPGSIRAAMGDLWDHSKGIPSGL